MKTVRSLLAAALTMLPLASRASQVWVAGSTEKIRPDAKPRNDVAANLTAARNEFEAFQIVITGPASKVSAKASPLQAATGAGRIDAVRLFREDLIDLAHPSALDGGTGRWPDALVPDVDEVVGEQRNAFPFDVAAGDSRAIWVEVHVPRDAAPGTYQGQVAVSTAAGQVAVPVSLEVWDFELPSTSSLRSSFGLSYGVLRAGHHTDGDAESALRARYAQLGLDHRISITSVADDGRDQDMNHFDQFYGALMDGTAPTQLQGAKLTALKFVGGRTSVGDHASWAKHFHDKGWFPRLFDYTCDEPPLTCRWDEIPPRAAAAHQADPGFQTLVTTQVWDADAKGVSSSIDIIVPNDNFTWGKPSHWNPGDQRAKYDAFLASAKQKEMWLYQSCMSHGCGGTVDIGNPTDDERYYTGWATYVIDASAVRNRAHEWLSFIEKVTGELYWEVAMAYTHDAWSNQYDFSGNGDGTLFYPGTPARIGGKTDIPVASIRLKMIREGMEDYEYLKLVSDGGDPAFARDVALKLFPSFYQTDVDPAALAAARAALAGRILQLQGKRVPASAGGTAAAATAGAATGGGGCGTVSTGAAIALLAFPLLARAIRRKRR